MVKRDTYRQTVSIERTLREIYIVKHVNWIKEDNVCWGLNYITFAREIVQVTYVSSKPFMKSIFDDRLVSFRPTVTSFLPQHIPHLLYRGASPL